MYSRARLAVGLICLAAAIALIVLVAAWVHQSFGGL